MNQVLELVLVFDSAMASVGGNSLGISDIISSSSTQKGESLADTVTNNVDLL